VRRALRTLYRRVAARRHCMNGLCSVPPQIPSSRRTNVHGVQGGEL
jgi:hypothetical protein